MDAEIQRREDELRKLRPNYKHYLAFTEQFDIAPAITTLFSYKAGESPEKAIFVLAQCQTELHDLWEALRVVKAFEAKETQLEKLKAVRPVE